MEIIWHYNLLESVAVIGGTIIGLYISFRILAVVYIYIWAKINGF